MGLTDWHRKDKIKAGDELRKPTPPTAKGSRHYDQTNIDTFCQMIRDGSNVRAAIQASKIPSSKAYDILNRDRDLWECHMRNKRGMPRYDRL